MISGRWSNVCNGLVYAVRRTDQDEPPMSRSSQLLSLSIMFGVASAAAPAVADGARNSTTTSTPTGAAAAAADLPTAAAPSTIRATEPATALVVPTASDTSPPLELRSGAIVVRPRLELRARLEALGPRTLAPGAAQALGLLRSRLGAEVELGEHLGAVVLLQDARQWGTEVVLPGSPPDVTVWGRAPGAFDLHEGYGRLSADTLSLEVGRQELRFANERLLGALDWANPGRALDAVRADYSSEHIKVLGFAALLSDTAPAIGGPDVVLVGAGATLRWSEALAVDALLLYDGAYDVVTYDRVTGGVRSAGRVGPVDYDLEAYLQATIASVDQLAYLLGARVAYAPTKDWRVGALFDVLSGRSEDGDVGTFHTMFGTNHKFYGFQDLFLNLPRDTRDQGLWDAGVYGELQRGALKLVAYVHLFGAASYTGPGSALYGLEPDLVLSYRLHERVKAELGASLFVPMGDALGRGDQIAPFSYLQLAMSL